MTEKTMHTARGEAPTLPRDQAVPTAEKLSDGQYRDHWVLSPEERGKGFVRPVREKYVHVGIDGPKFPLRDLNEKEKEFGIKQGWVKFEEYPEDYEGAALGRMWSQEQLDSVGSGCGTVTRMPSSCAETYARQPSFYGSTFCCGCGKYLPVGKDGEFVWDDARDERVGT